MRYRSNWSMPTARAALSVGIVFTLAACSADNVTSAEPQNIARFEAAAAKSVTVKGQVYQIAGNEIRHAATGNIGNLTAETKALMERYVRIRESFAELERCRETRGCVITLSPEAKAMLAARGDKRSGLFSADCGTVDTAFSADCGEGYNCYDGAVALMGATAHYRTAQAAADNAFEEMALAILQVDPPSFQQIANWTTAIANADSADLACHILAWQYEAYGCLQH